MDEISKRLLAYLEEKQISKSAFAEETGLNKATLSHIESGRNRVSLNIIEAFAKKFPNVDLNWLITGQSPSTISESPEKTTSKIEKQSAHTPPINLNDSGAMPSSFEIESTNLGLNKKSHNVIHKQAVEPEESGSLHALDPKEILMIYEDDSFRILKRK